jgi:hypothetical protein
MKTTFTKIARGTLYTVTALLALSANAKMSNVSDLAPINNTVQVNVQAEIKTNLNNMLANLSAPTIELDIARNINASAIELQTDELIRIVDQQLPGFRFKVVITD